MVAHLGLPTHELLNEGISNIFTEIYHQEREVVAIHSQRICNLILNNNFRAFLTIMTQGH